MSLLFDEVQKRAQMLTPTEKATLAHLFNFVFIAAALVMTVS